MQDMLFQIDSYTEPTPSAAIDQAVGFAKACGGRISALATHIDIRAPNNWLAEKLLGVNRMVEVEENKSLQAAQTSLRYFEETAGKADVFSEGFIDRTDLYAVGPCVSRHARTRDLCIVAIANRVDSQRSVAEDVVFGSGRPVLVFNPATAPISATVLDRVCVMWDGSRSAARAAADALPILAKASKVSIATIVGEKPSATRGIASDLVRHLRTHGVSAQVEVAEFHQTIGASIDAHIAKTTPQLLVMGAFGNSRLKDFVLGGATAYVLNNLRLPTILSH